MPKPITANEIKALLSYDADTGVFKWLVDCGSNKVKGCVAGTDKEGYINIQIKGQRYRAHILAWIYVHGETPIELDHENRNKKDNRISNLRKTTRTLNAQNRPAQRRSESGVSGVCYSRRNKAWLAHITTNKKHVHLGSFQDMNAAIDARMAAEKQYNFGVHNA